jgi:hypothetical protein
MVESSHLSPNAKQALYFQKGPRRQQKIVNAAACLCFLNYLAFLRPVADGTDSILPWVVSRGRSYGSLCFLCAESTIQNYEERSIFGLFASKRPRSLTAHVEVHWARRVQASIPQISGPDLRENHIIDTWKEEGRAISTQETAARREWEDGTFDTYICSLDR